MYLSSADQIFRKQIAQQGYNYAEIPIDTSSGPSLIAIKTPTNTTLIDTSQNNIYQVAQDAPSHIAPNCNANAYANTYISLGNHRMLSNSGHQHTHNGPDPSSGFFPAHTLKSRFHEGITVVDRRPRSLHWAGDAMDWVPAQSNFTSGHPLYKPGSQSSAESCMDWEPTPSSFSLGHSTFKPWRQPALRSSMVWEPILSGSSSAQSTFAAWNSPTHRTDLDFFHNSHNSLLRIPESPTKFSADGEFNDALYMSLQGDVLPTGVNPIDDYLHQHQDQRMRIYFEAAIGNQGCGCEVAHNDTEQYLCNNKDVLSAISLRATLSESCKRRVQEPIATKPLLQYVQAMRSQAEHWTRLIDEMSGKGIPETGNPWMAYDEDHDAMRIE